MTLCSEAVTRRQAFALAARRLAGAARLLAAALLAGSALSRCQIVIGLQSGWRAFQDLHTKAAAAPDGRYSAGSMLLTTAMSAVFWSSLSRCSALIAASMSGGGL